MLRSSFLSRQLTASHNELFSLDLAKCPDSIRTPEDYRALMTWFDRVRVEQPDVAVSENLKVMTATARLRDGLGNALVHPHERPRVLLGLSDLHRVRVPFLTV